MSTGRQNTDCVPSREREGPTEVTFAGVTQRDDTAGEARVEDKPIVVACYTGQTAGHVIVALRVMGHEAHLLKFGMASWSTTLADKWNSKVGDGLPEPKLDDFSGERCTSRFVSLPTKSVGILDLADPSAVGVERG